MKMDIVKVFTENNILELYDIYSQLKRSEQDYYFQGTISIGIKNLGNVTINITRNTRIDYKVTIDDIVYVPFRTDDNNKVQPGGMKTETHYISRCLDFPSVLGYVFYLKCSIDEVTNIYRIDDYNFIKEMGMYIDQLFSNDMMCIENLVNTSKLYNTKDTAFIAQYESTLIPHKLNIFFDEHKNVSTLSFILDNKIQLLFTRSGSKKVPEIIFVKLIAGIYLLGPEVLLTLNNNTNIMEYINLNLNTIEDKEPSKPKWYRELVLGEKA